MSNLDLAYYIQQQLDNQIPREQIIAVLEKVGWSKPDIDKAFADQLIKIEKPSSTTIGSAININPSNTQAEISFVKPSSTITSSEFSYQTKTSTKFQLPITKIIVGSIVLSLIVLITILFYIWGIPLYYLLSASINLSKLNSVQMNATIYQSNSGSEPLKITGNIHADPNAFSELTITSSNINLDNQTNHITANIIGNLESRQLFAKASISNASLIEQFILSSIPGVETLPDYTQIQDVIYGRAWAMIDLTNNHFLERNNLDNQPKEDELNYILKLIKLIKINKVYTTVDASGNKIVAYTFGIRKDKLSELVKDSLMQSEVTLTLPQINQIISIIDNSRGWDSDLMTLAVDKKTNQISRVDIFVNSEIFHSTVPVKLLTSEDLETLGLSKDLWKSILNNDFLTKPLITIKLDRHNQAEIVNPPVEFVNFDNIFRQK